MTLHNRVQSAIIAGHEPSAIAAILGVSEITVNAMKAALVARSFTVEQRGDEWYVVRLPDRSATGPCFCESERGEAVKYANLLNRMNNYPETE